MRIAAIYIPENTLPFIFGENHQGQTLNLGGIYDYEFNEDKTRIEVSQIGKNETYIDDFWGENISSITAIIGKNGVGKTSLLRALNNQIDTGNRKLIYVLESINPYDNKIINETNKQIISKITNVLNGDKHSVFEPLFYSPTLDYDLNDTLSPIALINYFKDNLENYFLDSITRNVFLLNDNVISEIKKIYEDFPYYNKITVSAKKHNKSTFRKIYLESNFGNPNRGDVLKNELEGFIMQLESHDYYKDSFSKKEVIDILKGNVNHLKSESFTEQFNRIWDLKDYKYLDKNGYDYIHNSDNFIKNIEVNILSYLLLSAVFARTPFSGGINFSEISKTKNFTDRLNFFLEMYFANEYQLLTDKIKKSLNGINLSDKEKMIAIIDKDTHFSSGGFEAQPIRDRMKKYIHSFYEVNEFYQYLIHLINSRKIYSTNGSIEFNFQTSEVNLFYGFVNRYKSLLSTLPQSPSSIALFDFIPNKKLSTGEKAILDFNASLLNYIENNKRQSHKNFSNYVLLLDEPELGFHPLWKKKFINALVKTIPILFSEIVPQNYNNDKKIYEKTGLKPNIQIFFTTHDPLTLSDIPNSNIIYLDKEKGTTSIVDKSKDIKKSFGGNITDLLSDGFFIQDGLIGEFAKDKIEETITWISEESRKKDILKSQYIINSADYEKHKKVISLIDEHIIRIKLAEMIEELQGEKKLQEDLIQKEIDFLNQRKNDLYKS
jgi:hypothetical protein